MGSHLCMHRPRGTLFAMCCHTWSTVMVLIFLKRFFGHCQDCDGTAHPSGSAANHQPCNHCQTTPHTVAGDFMQNALAYTKISETFKKALKCSSICDLF